jgi:hypothetical protein
MLFCTSTQLFIHTSEKEQNYSQAAMFKRFADLSFTITKKSSKVIQLFLVCLVIENLFLTSSVYRICRTQSKNSLKCNIFSYRIIKWSLLLFLLKYILYRNQGVTVIFSCRCFLQWRIAWKEEETSTRCNWLKKGEESYWDPPISITGRGGSERRIEWITENIMSP